MARDTQRQKVYDAERAAFGGSKPEGYSIAEMQQLIDKWRSSKVLQRHYPRATRPLRVADGRGRRRACFAPMGLFHDDELRMPRWSRKKWVLLHEFAHALTYSSARAWHGWEFCECYLYLVRVYIGRGAEEKLAREFKAHHVKYRKPRKRQMTEAQREAARQRMLAMHAERKAA